MPGISDRIYELLDASEVRDFEAYLEWSARAQSFLAKTFPNEAGEFNHLQDNSAMTWRRGLASQRGLLEGLAAKVEDTVGVVAALASSPAVSGVPESPPSKKVFVVHGHDHEAKDKVARFLERLKLEPVVLHEQPNEGRAVIEKFEVYAHVGFAVVLLTPDDVGALATERTNLKSRARQNVVFELGYFIGKLKRNRVCALYKEDVEVPSDYAGVLFTKLDSAGDWRTKLAQDLSAAGIPIDVDGLLKAMQ
jgi:predicted nucleotide-binding protein